MLAKSLRASVLAMTIVIPAALLTSPVAASCISLADMLPDPATPGSVVFVGTVVASDELTTDLAVDAWYLGELPEGYVQVVGGREPDVITSADWRPANGEQFVVVARSLDDTLITGTCMQSMPFPDLLEALTATYGEPTAAAADVSPGPSPVPSAPVVTSGELPLPGSLVRGTPPPEA